MTDDTDADSRPPVIVVSRSIIRYDTIKEFNMDSKADCVQLNLAHVARKNMKKEETKTNKRQCPFSSVQVQDP